MPVEGSEASFRPLPTHRGKIAGRLNFAEGDLAARVRFHAELDR
jgi:hypothetical protein